MHIQAPFEAYRGDEPYLFVSYAHRDSERVYPVLSMLRERGWRIWYDEGIDPGNEWTAFIEGALVGCAQMLCFISPNSVESLNCRQEINLAVDDGKSVLAVHLEETELRYGLRLRMSAFQAVMAHRIASNEELLRTLDRGLDPACRASDASSAIEPKDEAARTPARSLKGARASSRFAVIAGAAVAQKNSAVDRKVSAPRASDASRNGSHAPGRFMLFAGAAVALIAIAAFAAVVFAGRGGREASSPLPVAVQETTVGSAQETSPVEQASSLSGNAEKSGTPEKPATPDAAEKAAPQEPKKPQVPAVPKGFVLIDGGSFVMGTPAKEALSDDNELLHTVSLSPFYIGAREVTQSEWESVMGSNPSAFKGGSLPVESVSWYEAIAFCNKLSLKEGRKPCYEVNGKTDPARWGPVPASGDPVWDMASCDFSANGYRLPTEAEWEYACRSDTRTAFFTGANITTDQANYTGSKPYDGAPAGIDRGATLPAGSFAPNGFGLYDMSGNVWEWCNDWYGPYKEGADPSGPSEGATRIVRGGSWDTGAQFLRSGARGGNYPANPGNDLGLRLAFRQ